MLTVALIALGLAALFALFIGLREWFAWQIIMLTTLIRIFVVAYYYGLIEPRASTDSQHEGGHR